MTTFYLVLSSRNQVVETSAKYIKKKKLIENTISLQFFAESFWLPCGLESTQTEWRKKLTSKSFSPTRQFKTRIPFSIDCKSVTFNRLPFIGFYRNSGCILARRETRWELSWDRPVVSSLPSRKVSEWLIERDSFVRPVIPFKGFCCGGFFFFLCIRQYLLTSCHSNDFELESFQQFWKFWLWYYYVCRIVCERIKRVKEKFHCILYVHVLWYVSYYIVGRGLNDIKKKSHIDLLLVI